MNAEIVPKKSLRVMICSKNWVHQTALANIFIGHGWEICFNSHPELGFFPKGNLKALGLVVLDMPPRQSIALIIKIRKAWPGIFILFTQRYFLFSDIVVESYFKTMELKTYDAVMVNIPTICCRYNLDPVLLSYTSNPENLICIASRKKYVMNELNILLHKRLSDAISPRGADIVLNWIIRNIPLNELCRQSGLKAKTIYYYRETTMKSLEITHFARDFKASLTIESEPIGDF